eukprot:CAMPEP_0197446490 /NCGR_PEP_ID=MMETSP1175-20131217/11425_1 /TAXON_ID=1003142 /ORGANISM="Triceratium dubium, Strain CCMP147" /LENGTH=340 /DNA_ID=CAMNT_0042977615 /DNA_START=239 /DNA_END=1261 /DNA_ORIENTATION=-
MVESQRGAKQAAVAAPQSRENDDADPKQSNGSTDTDSKEELSRDKEDEVRTPKRVMFAAVLVLVISYLTFPDSLQPVGRPTVQHVWYFGWISALSTGLGVLPLVIAPKLDTFWVGVSNAIAAGMMVAASYSLMVEGCTFDEPDDISQLSSTARTFLGAGLGLAFIVGTKNFLEQHEELHIGSLAGADFRRVLLIIFVMTLHSFSEGVGIGVSFGGENGSELGVFISASLAVHNVPEGLAVAVVLLPRKVSKLTAALWCILTSIPQPIMAVPAFLFVHYFIPILPVGLGFAGGAMAWVAFFELLAEAFEDTKSNALTVVISTASFATMMALQNSIDESSRS